jgi:hypothetical protein
MQALVLSLLLMQSNVNMNPHTWAEQQRLLLEMQQRRLAEQPPARVLQELHAQRQAALEHYFFAQKFNKLVHQLKEFADQYNTGAVNAKKVKAIKKAWEDLQKTDGWFKHMETKDKGAPPNDKLQASLAAVE